MFLDFFYLSHSGDLTLSFRNLGIQKLVHIWNCIFPLIDQDEENLYRNAKQVRYLDLLGVHNFCIAAMVATLTISFDEQPLDKSWTGFFNPCRSGPHAEYPAKRSVIL